MHENTAGFAADTEILTRRGWLTFDQLTYFDEIAARSPEGQFEWQCPEIITWQPYEGDMVRLHSRTADMLVAPQSPLLYLKRNRPRINGKPVDLPPIETRCAAGDMVGQRLSLVATSRWEPPGPQRAIALVPTRVRTSGRPALEFTASATDFAAFMGMYLAEGNLGPSKGGNYAIWIWQKYGGRGFAEFQDLLNRLTGRELPHVTKGGWHFSNKALYEYLKTCGGYAHTKRIPREVLDLPAEALEEFWRFYCLGDGTVMKNPGRKPVDVVSTTSEGMAGDLQEVLQKLGGWSLIQCIDFSKYPSKLGATTRLTYRLIRRAGDVAFASAIDRIPYSGMLGSARAGVAAIYVRRGNRPVWSAA